MLSNPINSFSTNSLQSIPIKDKNKIDENKVSILFSRYCRLNLESNKEISEGFKSYFQEGGSIKIISEYLANECSRKIQDHGNKAHRWIFKTIILLDAAGLLISPYYLRVLVYKDRQDLEELRCEMVDWQRLESSLRAIATSILAFNMVGQITFYEVPILEKVIEACKKMKSSSLKDPSAMKRAISDLENVVRELKKELHHKVKRD